MKQTGTSKGNTGSKSISKSTAQKGAGGKKLERNNSKNIGNKYKIDAITRDNFDIGSRK